MKLTKIQVAKTVAKQDGLPEHDVVECLTNKSLYSTNETTYWFPDRNQKLDYRLFNQLSRANFLVIAIGATMTNTKLLSMFGAIEIGRFAIYDTDSPNMKLEVVADVGSDPFTKQRRYAFQEYHSVSDMATDIYMKIQSEKKEHLSTLVQEVSSLSGVRLVQHLCDSGIQAALQKSVKCNQ